MQSQAWWNFTSSLSIRLHSVGINIGATLLFTFGFVIFCLTEDTQMLSSYQNSCVHLCGFISSVNYKDCLRWFTQDVVCVVFGAITGWSGVRHICSLLRAALGTEVSVSMLTSGGRDCHGLRPRGVSWRPACSALQLHRGVFQPTMGWSPGPPNAGLHSIIPATTVPRLFRQFPQEAY